MINGKSVLALVTARGGSKGLPGKNLRDLCGKPVIAWSIEAARGARCVDDLVVSTDDATIAEIAGRFGARVPFLRPAELASDTTSSIDVIEHAIKHLAAYGKTFDYLVLIEPTSPLRESSDIDAAMERLVASDAESIVSVCRAESVHPAFMYRKDKTDRLVPFTEQQPEGLRRQEIEPLYFLEGTIYASRVSTLLERRTFYHDATIGYEVPKWKSPEIDDIVDFLLVEAIIKHRGLTS